MTKSIKRILITVFALCALCLLCACTSSGEGTSGETPAASLRSDVPSADIASAVEEAISSEGLIAVDEGYILGRMQIDTSKCQDFVVKITSIGTAIDEFGIFRASDEASAKEVAAQVEGYFERYLASWMDEYRPEEKPKLQNAEVITQGVYVVYTIVGNADAEAAFATVDSLIH